MLPLAARLWEMTSAEHTPDREPLELTTAVPGLGLRDLDPSEAQAFVDLVVRNRDHVMAGNGSVPPDRVEEVVAWMCPRWDRNFGLALWLDDTLIGHITVSHLTHDGGDVEALLAQSPDGWGIGYWLGSEYTGHGYVTEACRTLMDFVRTEFGATDFYSGTLVTNTAKATCRPKPARSFSAAPAQGQSFFLSTVPIPLEEQRAGGARY